MMWRPETIGLSRLGTDTLFARIARDEEREEMIDQLRRAVRLEAKRALVDAGLGAATGDVRRRYHRAQRAVVRAGALVTLSPDLDARQIHANVLLAARRYRDAVIGFRAIRDQAPDRLHRDAAALGISLGLSLLHEADESHTWCAIALRSPFAAVADHAALTLLVQSVRRADREGTKAGLAATSDALGEAAPSIAARLLARYLCDAPLARRAATSQLLGASGSRGSAVHFHLEEVLESCAH
jgi:hypothetical protein